MFPVEAKLGEIRQALADGRDVVLTAPPGSGKTTCVPPALLDEPWLAGKKIVMLEPRRLAARNCAAYIARKTGGELGGLVGYQVRLERKISKATRLEVVTEGLLTNRIMDDPELKDVGLIIFDEFHERSLQCDLAYALALDVKRGLRPDLRILVMSATLNAEEVMTSLAGGVCPQLAGGVCPQPQLVRAEGRMFPVETRYLGEMSMSAAIGKALAETDGDILCFLPGEGEIRRTQEHLGSVPSYRQERLGSVPAPSKGSVPDIEILPLYGMLSKEEQDRVFRPSSRRKVILATSIAETSLTIEGITTVIDSGLMRVPKFSPATGMTGLVTLALTMDRAEQRRGRAGRVRAGVCYRLWSESSESSRPKRMMPEILDADLTSLVLTSFSWGATRREDLPWMTPPPASSWGQSLGVLKLLGAVNESGALTDKGKKMAKLPLHPRLANMLLAAGTVPLAQGTDPSERGTDPLIERAARLAAILEEGAKGRETDIRFVTITSQIRQLSSRFEHAIRGLSPISRGLSKRGQTPEARGQTPLSEGALLALAYPDRVGKNRGNGTFTMVSGRGAFLPDDDPLVREPYLVACELDDRQGDAKIFRCCPIAEAEIENLFDERIVEEAFCEWDRREERVKAALRRRLGAMTLGEKPVSGGGREQFGEAMTQALLEGVRQKGVENLPCWTKESRQMRSRIDFLARHLDWQPMSDEALVGALAGFVFGMTKWRDLEKIDLFAVMDFLLAENGHDRRELDRLAPSRLEVPSGSHMTVHYEGEEPTVAVKLQECFGMMESPKVADGRVPVVMTLLSPAQRPIQITKDLAGFWRGAYQLVRKDMRGRYPKHYWPEDPLTAVAMRRTIKRG